MNILIVTSEHIVKDERYLDDKGWSFKKAFEKLDMRVDSFFYKKKGRFSILEKKKYIKDVWHHYMNKQLIEHVRKFKPHLLLVITGDTIEPETLQHIRKSTDAVLMNIFTDNPFIFMKKFDSISQYNYFFIKDTYILSTLKKAGLKNIFYLPQCTDPDVHKPMSLSPDDKAFYSADLTLLGSMYPYRLKLMEQLVDFNLAIWGRGWNKASNKEILKYYRGKDIRGTQKTNAICAATISLNPHHPLNDINGTGSRTFDIAACKGFQLADYKKDMEDLFKINEEIICFKTMEELKRLITYYLKHPDERVEIVEAAYQKVLKEHTYYSRAKEILEIIKTEY